MGIASTAHRLLPQHYSRHLFDLQQIQKKNTLRTRPCFWPFFVCFWFPDLFLPVFVFRFDRFWSVFHSDPFHVYGIVFSFLVAHPRQIRQYFKDDTFYVTDLEARGLCDDDMDTTAFPCEEFGPSAATVKVIYSYPLSPPHGT